MLSLRSGAGKEFQKRGPTADKLLSRSCLCVLCTVHIKESAIHNDWHNSNSEKMGVGYFSGKIRENHASTIMNGTVKLR